MTRTREPPKKLKHDILVNWGEDVRAKTTFDGMRKTTPSTVDEMVNEGLSKEPIVERSQDEYARMISLEHSSSPPDHGVNPDKEGRPVLQYTLPVGRVLQSEEHLTVTTSVTGLHSLHNPCAAMGIADDGGVGDGGGGGDKETADAILGQGGDTKPSGSSSTAECSPCSLLTPAPPSVGGGSLNSTTMYEEDILSDHTIDEEGGQMIKPEVMSNDDMMSPMAGDDMMTQYDDVGGGRDDMSGGGGACDDVVRCRVKKDWCSTHNCGAKVIKVSGQKWRWKEKQKCYGYVSVKTSKIICSAKTRSKGPTVINQNLCTAVQGRGNLEGGKTGPTSETVDQENRE